MQLQLESKDTEQIRKSLTYRPDPPLSGLSLGDGSTKCGYLILGGFNNTENISGSRLSVKAWGRHLVESVPKQNVLQLCFFP